MKVIYLGFTLFCFLLVLSVLSSAERRGGDDDDGGSEGGEGSSPSTSTSSTKCTNDLSSLKLTFSTSNFSCNSAWTSQSFTLMYQHTGPNLWSFVLVAPDRGGYISVGFSPRGGMIGSSVVAGWVPSGSTGIIKQYLLNGYSSNQCPPDTGNLKMSRTGIVSQGSKIYMAFQLTVGQPETKLVYAVGSAPRSDSLLPHHSTMASATIDYTTGLSSTSGGSTDTLKKAHGFFAILGWGVLIPIGVTMARYFKHKDPFWFHAHISIQVVGFLFGLTCIITGFALEDKVDVEVDTHKGLGIFIFVLGCLQVMAFLARPNKAAKIRRYWNWYHHNVGRLAIIFGVANIFYGISLAKEDQSWSLGFGAFLAIWIITCIALEIRTRLRN